MVVGMLGGKKKGSGTHMFVGGHRLNPYNVKVEIYKKRVEHPLFISSFLLYHSLPHTQLNHQKQNTKNTQKPWPAQQPPSFSSSSSP